MKCFIKDDSVIVKWLFDFVIFVIPITEIVSIGTMSDGLGFREIFYLRLGSPIFGAVVIRRPRGWIRGIVIPHYDSHRFVFEVKRLIMLNRHDVTTEGKFDLMERLPT